MSAFEVRQVGRSAWVGVLEFDATELRNIAYALGLDDRGAEEMLALADHLDVVNGVAPRVVDAEVQGDLL